MLASWSYFSTSPFGSFLPCNISIIGACNDMLCPPPVRQPPHSELESRELIPLFVRWGRTVLEMKPVDFGGASTGPYSFSCVGAGVGQISSLSNRRFLEDVLCGLFCFFTGTRGGWHEGELLIHIGVSDPLLCRLWCHLSGGCLVTELKEGIIHVCVYRNLRPIRRNFFTQL